MAYIEFRDICKSYDGENQELKNNHSFRCRKR